jgi:hypothetical protein
VSRRLDELALRRERLVSRAAEQRAALAVGASALLPSVRLGDRLTSIGRAVCSHPAWAVAGAVALGAVLIRRGRATVWLGRAGMAWRAWQMVQVWLRGPASD